MRTTGRSIGGDAAGRRVLRRAADGADVRVVAVAPPHPTLAVTSFARARLLRGLHASGLLRDLLVAGHQPDLGVSVRPRADAPVGELTGAHDGTPAGVSVDFRGSTASAS